MTIRPGGLGGVPGASSDPAHPAPVAPTAGQAARLRDALAAADFTVDGVAALLGDGASAALHRDQLLPARRRVVSLRSGGDGRVVALATLVELFTLGDPVRGASLDAALPGLGARGLLDLGLVVPGCAGELRATCDLRPYADEHHAWWVASDPGETSTGGPLPPDHVLGIGGASLTLASWTPRPAVRRLLDVGTGCGVQALHAAAHTDHIVATDVSRRALAYAAFNAALAGQRWDLRAGDLFAPVGGERFDLIVSNPPFVVSPRAAGLPRYEYRDGGRSGDRLLEAFVAEVGDHLAPGGIACFLGNWETAPGQDWTQRWESWLAGSGLDAWVVEREAQDPYAYAETWTRDGGHRPGTPDHDRWYGAWLDDFASRDVDRIGFGVAVLQRPLTARAPWRDLTGAHGSVATPMGPAVLAGVMARTWLADHGDAGVLATAWRCASDVTTEQHGRPGAPDPEVILARQGGGLGRVVRLDTVAAAFLGVCDGDLPAGAALAAIAGLLGHDTDSVVASALPVVRGLVADGFLVPAAPVSRPDGPAASPASEHGRISVG